MGRERGRESRVRVGRENGTRVGCERGENGSENGM